MRSHRIAALLLVAIGGCADATSTTTTSNQQAVAVAPSSQVPVSFLRKAKSLKSRMPARTAPLVGAARQAQSAIDTLTSFTRQFTADGFDSEGNPQSVWPYTMVGRDPQLNRTTRFKAPIIPVTVEMLDANGNVGKTATGAPLRMVTGNDTIQLTLNSPVFQKFPYNTGNTQFTDGMMRAQFFNEVGDRDADRDDQGYHTILEPSVKRARTIQLKFGSYRFAPKPDGSCCLFVLADINEFANQLFPPTADDTTTVMGAAEHAGDMTTKDITTLLFRDVFLFFDDPANCCVLGFHSIDVEPGTRANGNRERDFVMNYSSYMSDGIFSGGFEDVTAFSHEMSELFADPFVNNATPWWLSLDPFNPDNPGLCQNNLETGDVVEVLSSNAVHAVPLHNRTYHPSNEALLQWFAFESPSSAKLGAYSWPDETTVTTLSPGPLLPGCVPAQ
ncbi:MAG TPA: hypothetical protein VFK02_27520 [Kofleriaceae bacterium]|nr:hypothetical protein [Kofleriaceae bacterium]